MWRPCVLKLLHPNEVGRSRTVTRSEATRDHSSGALGEPERALVRRRRRERLVEGNADRRLPDVQGLDLVDLRLGARLELAPAELGEVAGAAHPRGRRGEERLRAQQVTKRRLGLGVDLADEKGVRSDLPADLVERRDEERRAAHPLAVPLLVKGGVEGVAPGAQQRTGALLR